MEKKNLYKSDIHQECLERIDKLTADTQPQWGKMSAAQMLSHCAEIQEVTNGKELKGTPFIVKIFKGFIKKMVINEKPYPKSTQTHPQYKQRDDKDFEEEKARLKKALQNFVDNESRAEEIKHTLFGEMTADEKGWAMYKHLDHHLKQFGV